MTLDDKFILYEDCVKAGKDLLASAKETTDTQNYSASPPTSEDLAVIMYTSGTT